MLNRTVAGVLWIALTAASGPRAPADLPGVDSAVAAFMAKYSIPGLSLAITRDEKLVYVKAYGKADDTHAATPRNLFRLASVSKQITSIAIMRLMDARKISLGQKVFGPGAILGTEYGTAPYGPKIENITVGDLLHHTAGGWQNDGTDPMFTHSSMTAAQLISWTLDNRLADRKPNEVQYYGQNGEDPYAYNIARMDSHGGWLATATDLAKILVHVDSFPAKPDILTPNAIHVMTTASTANATYACGWLVNGIGSWFHNGSLPGTATEIARTVVRGRYNFVILTNTRSAIPTFSADLDKLFWTAESTVKTWPSADLF